MCRTPSARNRAANVESRCDRGRRRHRPALPRVEHAFGDEASVGPADGQKLTMAARQPRGNSRTDRQPGARGTGEREHDPRARVALLRRGLDDRPSATPSSRSSMAPRAKASSPPCRPAAARRASAAASDSVATTRTGSTRSSRELKPGSCARAVAGKATTRAAMQRTAALARGEGQDSRHVSGGRAGVRSEGVDS